MKKVSFTAFRDNLATYLDRLAKGEELVIMNAKRNKVLVSIKGRKQS